MNSKRMLFELRNRKRSRTLPRRWSHPTLQPHGRLSDACVAGANGDAAIRVTARRSRRFLRSSG